MNRTYKRILIIISLFAIAFSAFYLCQETKIEATRPGEFIRLHVVANSDSAPDQDLKRKVRDEIVRSVAPEFLETDNIASARGIARNNLDRIQGIAEREIRANGKEYPVSVELDCFSFPTKHYGPFILPAGDYEAVRVVIGEGGGTNWWCVLFPPLCFVDMTKTASIDPPLNGEMVTITPLPYAAPAGGEPGAANGSCYGTDSGYGIGKSSDTFGSGNGFGPGSSNGLGSSNGSGSVKGFDTGSSPAAPCPIPLPETDGSFHSGQAMTDTTPETGIRLVFSFRILEFFRSLKA